jgi:hypothetical protein
MLVTNAKQCCSSANTDFNEFLGIFHMDLVQLDKKIPLL